MFVAPPFPELLMGKFYSLRMKGRWALDQSYDPRVDVGEDGVRLLRQRLLQIVGSGLGSPLSVYIVPPFGLVPWRYLPRHCFLA